MIINQLSNVQNAWLFYGVVIATMLLLRVPYIGAFLRSTTTLVHEMSHAFMAFIMGGSSGSMEINPDRSGSIKTAVKSRFGRVMVSLAGYIMTAAFVAMAFFFVKIGYYDWLLLILLLLGLIGLIFFVRNAFGVIWLIVFCTADVILMSYGSVNLKMWVSLIISLVMFAESVLSTVELVVVVAKNPSQGSDAKNLSNEIKVPAFLWATFIFILVGYISYLTIVWFFPYGEMLKF